MQFLFDVLIQKHIRAAPWNHKWNIDKVMSATYTLFFPLCSRMFNGRNLLLLSICERVYAMLCRNALRTFYGFFLAVKVLCINSGVYPLWKLKSTNSNNQLEIAISNSHSIQPNAINRFFPLNENALHSIYVCTKIKIVRFYCRNCAFYTDCDLSVYMYTIQLAKMSSNQQILNVMQSK